MMCRSKVAHPRERDLMMGLAYVNSVARGCWWRGGGACTLG